MYGIVHRLFYVVAVLFFAAVGMLIAFIGEVEFFKTSLSPKLFEVMYNQPDPNVSITLISVGMGMAVLSMLIGFCAGFVCKFSTRVITPNKVDALKAQDVAVFLVDGKVFKRNDAEAYNLEDMSRVRISISRNLYFTILDETIIIIPEEENTNDQILHSDMQSEKSETGREEGDSENFSL